MRALCEHMANVVGPPPPSSHQDITRPNANGQFCKPKLICALQDYRAVQVASAMKSYNSERPRWCSLTSIREATGNGMFRVRCGVGSSSGDHRARRPRCARRKVAALSIPGARAAPKADGPSFTHLAPRTSHLAPSLHALLHIAPTALHYLAQPRPSAPSCLAPPSCAMWTLLVLAFSPCSPRTRWPQAFARWFTHSSPTFRFLKKVTLWCSAGVLPAPRPPCAPHWPFS